MKTLVCCGFMLLVAVVSGDTSRTIVARTSLQQLYHYYHVAKTLRHRQCVFTLRGGGGDNFGTVGGGGGGGGAHRTVPRTIPPPAQYGTTSEARTMEDARRQQQRQEADDAREVLNSFLTRDSRNTFIGAFCSCQWLSIMLDGVLRLHLKT